MSVRYPGALDPALHEVSLRVPAGARVALVGPNGSGKSSLLKAVAGLLPVRSGDVKVYGNPVGACHHRVAYLPQRGELDWRFPVSVRRLVMTGRYVHLGWLRRPGKEDRRLAERVMKCLGLSGLAEKRIGKLSGGQQQRALLARALVQEGDLILLDEPTNAVDSETRAAISETLSELRRQGKSLIVATHDLAGLADEFDGVLYLRDGREAEPEPGSFVGMPVGKGAAWAG
jgi:manganese/zinc/iron transport system ATP- binding protein